MTVALHEIRWRDVVISRRLPLFVTGSWAYGSACLRAGRLVLLLKAPWNEPLFMERYGKVHKIRLGFGWRILARLIPRGRDI